MTRSRHIAPPRIPYGPEEDAIITALFPVNATAEVAKLIDRTPSGVAQRAERLGVVKCPEYLATKAHRRNGSEPASIANRFKPGQVPANKGLRRPGYAPGRMASTQFRKGRPAHESRNYLPIGSERISKDGYLEEKVTDSPALVPARRWVAVHRLVWEAANGPIPPAHAIAFLPGRKTARREQITVDALELVTRAEMCHRNSRHTNYPPELNRLLALKGALTRKINHRSKAS